jgi:hypothetical protein
LGTYGWHYDEPFYGAEALDACTQLVPGVAERAPSANAFIATTLIMRRLPSLTMARWNFDSGLPLARCLAGTPLLLFKFDPVRSRVPYALITILGLFYVCRYARTIAEFFNEETTWPRPSKAAQDIGLIVTILLISVSPTCFFQAHFVMPQTISFLLLSMACQTMASGFIQNRPSRTAWAMVLFVTAIILNYQNLLLAPFIVFNLLFFGLACGRRFEAGSAFVVLCGLLAAFVGICRDGLISAFGINVAGARASSLASAPLADRIGELWERLNTIVDLVGVPAVLCVTGCLLAVAFGAARSGPKRIWHPSRFAMYCAGTAITALTVPGLFLFSSNQSSAVKYLIAVPVLVSPLFLVALTRLIALLTTSIGSEPLSTSRAFINTALALVAVIALVGSLGNACVSRFAWNYDYEGIMRQWIPVLYAGQAKGLVFGSDWYQHTFAFTGGDLTLSRDFAYVPPGQLPERPQGMYSAIRLVNDPSRDYWTDPTLTSRPFDYAAFLKERDHRLDTLRPFVLSATLAAVGAFVALHCVATGLFRRREARSKE